MNKNNDKIIINHTKYTKEPQTAFPSSFCPSDRSANAKLMETYLNSVTFLCIFCLFLPNNTWLQRFLFGATPNLDEIVLNADVVYLIVENVYLFTKIFSYLLFFYRMLQFEVPTSPNQNMSWWHLYLEEFLPKRRFPFQKNGNVEDLKDLVSCFHSYQVHLQCVNHSSRIH